MRTSIFVLCAAAALTLAGCGSSSASSHPAGGGVPATTASTFSSTTDTAPSTTATTATTATAAPTGSPASTGSPGAPSSQPSSHGPVPSPTSVVGALNVTFADSGKTVALQVGGRLHVVLDSTFWTFDRPAPGPLKLDGSSTGGAGLCQPPGTGCGWTFADFTGVSAGTAVVTASRVSCGEAKRCVGDQGRFSLKVVVQG